MKDVRPVRDTRQRAAIRELFAHADRPLSPQEVLKGARARVKRLGLATVYRTLKSLIDDGALVAVELPGQPPRYEVAGKHHHHHFHCRGCGRLFDIEGCPSGLRTMAPPGFEVDGHEVTLYGKCPACAAA